MFIAPDAEHPLQAGHDGDWDAETEALASRGIYVFDRLAPAAATLLERSPALRRLYSDRYPLVIVDEFQDTNLDQWRVIRELAKGSTVICLADPDQRIFEGFVKGVDDKRLQQAVDTLTPQRFDLADDNHRSGGNGILDYANAVLHGQPAPQPGSVRYLTYRYPATAEQVTHQVILYLQAQLPGQLGRIPSIAVLAPTRAFAAALSEAISADRQNASGQLLSAVDHELVWDPGLSAAAGFVVASILEWPVLGPAEAITGTLRSIADFYRTKMAISGRRTAAALSAIAATENAITAVMTGKPPRAKGSPQNYLGYVGRVGIKAEVPGRDAVIPVPVKLVRCDDLGFQVLHLLLGDLDPGRVAAGVQLGLHPQPGPGRGGPDRLQDHLVALQRAAPPVHRDRGEQPVVKSARGEVPSFDRAFSPGRFPHPACRFHGTGRSANPSCS